MGSELVEVVFLLLFVADAANLEVLRYPPDHGPQLCESGNTINYDFIVCGAGSAGATLASRLSEEPDFNVLLLERGNDPGEGTEVPIRWAGFLKSDIDYQYVSEQDELLYKGLHGEVSAIPRGKVAGGCSSVNVCVYTRGHRRDFDGWAQRGCAGWDYESVAKYFRKAEDYRGAESRRRYHATGGPLTVSPFVAPDPAIDVFSRGLLEVGVPRIPDLNGPVAIGSATADSTTRDGRRWSTFKAYLSLAASRPNMFFARGVLVRKVIFDKRKRAVGVEITAPSGKICVIKASREVILSLGAIGTPQALMLSGVGPKEALAAVGVEQLVESPAGTNYQDHLCFVGTVFTDRKGRPPEQVSGESSKLIRDTLQLVADGISTVGLTELVAFVDTTNASEYPDIELMLMRISYRTLTQTDNGQNKMYNMFGLSEETAHLFTLLNEQTDLIFVIVILLDFESSGYIELRSPDPADYPKIRPQFLSHPNDVATMVRALKFVHRLSQTNALTEYGLTLEHVNYEKCSHTKPFSDEYWTCALEQIATGFYHPGCSAKMGASNDKSAVLTPRLRVKGVRGLRVVDASAMPKMVSSNPNAAVIMMAEKAADLIKKDNEKSIFNTFRRWLTALLRLTDTEDGRKVPG